MRRSLSILGLVALLGCDGTGDEGGAPLTEAESVIMGEEGVAPRVSRFAPLPAGALERSGTQPEAWARDTQTALTVETTELRAHFDPKELGAAEAHRRNAKMLRGAP